MKKLIYLFVFVMLAYLSNAQENIEEKPMFYIGGFLHFNYNIHSADFKALPDCFSCSPLYSSGTGAGFALGGLFEYPLNNEFNLGLRIGYSMLDAKLTNDETIGNALSKGITPAVEKITVQHLIDSKLRTIGFEPYINYRFFDKFYTTIGLKLAYLSTAEFSQSEEIKSPDYVVFTENNTTKRNVYTQQEIPEKNSLLFYGNIGFGYEFPLFETGTISPEVRFEIPFTSVSSVNWKPGALNLGLAVKFPIYKAGKPTLDSIYYERDTNRIFVKGLKDERITKIDERKQKMNLDMGDYFLNKTVIKEYYKQELPGELGLLAAKVDLMGINPDGTETKVPQIIIEELETEEVFPLLPYVFFKNNDSKLENTSMVFYDKFSTFDENNLPWDALKIHQNLLNIIAHRLKAEPNAKISITGTNNNTALEKNNLDLSLARAEAVRDYFVAYCGIDEKRITVNYQNLPDQSANNQRKEGLEENQRVEISSDDYNILKPITLKEIHKTSNPPLVRINPNIEAKEGLRKWSVDVSQGGKIIREYSGDSSAEPIYWNIENEPIPSLDEPVKVTITAIDKMGQLDSSSSSIAIEQKTIQKKKVEMKGDKKVEKFSLILFDYDKSNITPQQAEFLKLVKSKIKPNSQVNIYGYTDKTGDNTHNLKLSLDRANEVKKLLSLNEKQGAVFGNGSKVELYDNNSPEGRSYSRTVKVVIETPVE